MELYVCGAVLIIVIVAALVGASSGWYGHE
jgi:hypothetical protein